MMVEDDYCDVDDLISATMIQSPSGRLMYPTGFVVRRVCTLQRLLRAYLGRRRMQYTKCMIECGKAVAKAWQRQTVMWSAPWEGYTDEGGRIWWWHPNQTWFREGDAGWLRVDEATGGNEGVSWHCPSLGIRFSVRTRMTRIVAATLPLAGHRFR